MKTAGQIAYEQDVLNCPTYHDGQPRKTWQKLDDVTRLSWEQNPTPKHKPVKIEQKESFFSEALLQLKNHQKQLDQDGTMVGVSRQALDEVITSFEAQLASVTAQREWQPIETAPLDGSWVLIWGAHMADGPWTAFWDTQTVNGKPVSGWNTNNTKDWEFSNATHWMPLPPPPAIKSIQGEGK